MKPFVKLTSNSFDKDFIKGDTGFVDGYVNVDGCPCAVVILTKNNQFCIAKIWQMEFISYDYTK